MDIREARLTLGMTQAEMAEMLSIDAPLLSKIENGIVEPSASMYDIVFKALASRSNARNRVGTTNISTTKKWALKTEIYRAILNALEYSSFSQPISRDSLRVWTKCSDRQTRDAIMDLRKMGYRIGAYSGGKGYWMCRSDAEYQLVRNMYLSKARDMLETVSAMDRNIDGQMEWDFDEAGRDIHKTEPQDT